MATAQQAIEPETPAAEEIRYIAKQRLKVGFDKKTRTEIFREYDEEIPEAIEWNGMMRARYIQEGRIAQIAVVGRGRGRPRKAEA